MNFGALFENSLEQTVIMDTFSSKVYVLNIKISQEVITRLLFFKL